MNQQAIEIIRQYQDAPPPMNVFALARDAGLEIRRSVMGEGDIHCILEGCGRDDKKYDSQGLRVILNSRLSPSQRDYAMALAIAYLGFGNMRKGERLAIGAAGKMCQREPYRDQHRIVTVSHPRLLAAAVEVLMPRGHMRAALETAPETDDDDIIFAHMAEVLKLPVRSIQIRFDQLRKKQAV